MLLGGLSMGTPSVIAADEPEPVVISARGKQGMVVSARPEASRIGKEILQRGGNAVDAAVATAFALAVTHPEAGNIGGGGFMLVWPGKDAQPVCVEYRETAPAAARADMYAVDETRYSARTVGTPGTVRGLALAHEKFGKLPWKELVQPAAKLASEGFVLDAELAKSLNELLKKFPEFSELRRVYGPPSRAVADPNAAADPSAAPPAWKAGDRLRLPDLGRTLTLIAEQGPEAFYRGPIADQIVAEMKASGGLISAADLENYRAQIREPIRSEYRGYTVYGPPPPSSGGIALVEMLQILEPFQLREKGRNSAEAYHLIVEAMRRAYRDRAAYLGDPAFTNIPADLLTRAHADAWRKSIDLARATPSAELARDIPLTDESEQTTHFSVVDKDGMAVANTYTLEDSFGSRVVVRGGGFLLNNEMTDFNWRPGRTDRQGGIGTPANTIAPGKRMLSSQTPCLVVREGKVVLVTGSPGGRTIINTVLKVVLEVLEFEQDLRTAVDAPRLHHAWFPDQIKFEGLNDPAFQDLIADLKNRGHLFDRTVRPQGDAHSIRIDPHTGEMQGEADRRRANGTAAGW